MWYKHNKHLMFIVTLFKLIIRTRAHKLYMLTAFAFVALAVGEWIHYNMGVSILLILCGVVFAFTYAGFSKKITKPKL